MVNGIKTIMHNELPKCYLKRLNETNLQWWLDSGTLLGLVRDGQLLSSDPDIDISVIINGKKEISKLLTTIDENKDTIEVFVYRGKIHKIKIISPKIDRKIDVNIFRSKNENGIIWCPAINRTPPIDNKIVYNLLKGVNYIYAKINRGTWRSDSKLARLTTKGIRTWIYPLKYFDHELSSNCFGAPIPNKTEDYLNYRFGKWTVPDDSWNYWTDDGAIFEQPPSHIK